MTPSEDAGLPSEDAGQQDATTTPVDSGADTSTAPSDAGHDASQDAEADAADAAVGPYLLVSYYYDGYNDTEYSAFNVATGQVEGLGYTNFGVNVSSNEAPWVLQQDNDLVLRMNPNKPWEVTSSWSTASVPEENTFGTYTDSFAVAEVGTKAYVIGYDTDYVAVYDTSVTSDGGAPTKTIPLIATPDASGNMEAISISYDAAQGKVWVVLGNSNQPYPPLCAPGANPFVVGIDTTTDAVVGAPYSLQGYGTAFATNAVVFDGVNERLLVATEGCSDPVDAGDGSVGAGAADEAYIEEVSLAGGDAGASKVLLTLSPSNSPTGFVYVDATHAFVQTANGPTYAWDPTQSSLGGVIANAPDAFVWDGKGHLLGPKSTLLSNDAGVSIAIVAVDPTDGGVTTLATNPFTQAPANPFAQQTWQSVDLWPHP